MSRGRARLFGAILLLLLGHEPAAAEVTGVQTEVEVVVAPIVDPAHGDAAGATERDDPDFGLPELYGIEATPAELRPLPLIEAPPPDVSHIGDATEAVERIREMLTRMVKYLEEARSERDFIKLNCINEKLSAVKGLLKITEQAGVTLQECVARKDGDAALHEVEKITIALRKCEQLSSESEGCVGELAAYSGGTEVEVIDEEPQPDVEVSTWSPGSIVERPPAASPYQ